MKPKNLFLVVLALLASFAKAQQVKKEGVVTAQEYCDFLNHIAACDIHHFYEEASKLIVRSGEVGNYHYEITNPQSGIPMDFLTIDNEEGYCFLANQDPSISSVPISLNRECDQELKSNLGTFEVLSSLEEGEADSNKSCFDTMQHLLSSSVFYGMLVDPLLINRALRDNSPTAAQRDPLQEGPEKGELRKIIDLCVLRENSTWEGLSKERDERYEDAYKSFFDDQLKAKKDLHAAEKLQEAAHDYRTRREEAESKDATGSIVETANEIAGIAGNIPSPSMQAVSLAATGVSVAVQMGSFLRKKGDQAVAQVFDEHLQTSAQELQERREKTSSLLGGARDLEESFFKNHAQETDLLAAAMQLNHSRLEEWAVAIIKRAKVDQGWKSKIMQADPSWIDQAIAHGWDKRIKQSGDYLQSLQESEEKKEIDRLRESYEEARKEFENAREALQAAEEKKRKTSDEGANAYHDFRHIHEEVEQPYFMDFNSIISIDKKIQEEQNKLARTAELHRTYKTAAEELEYRDEAIEHLKKGLKEKEAAIKNLYQQCVLKHGSFSKKIARAEKRLEIDKVVKEKYWPEKSLSECLKNRTWGKTFAKARASKPETKEAWIAAHDEAEKVKKLYDRVIEKQKNREDLLLTEYPQSLREREILEGKIAVALEKIKALEEPALCSQGSNFLKWKFAGALILLPLFWQSYSFTGAQLFSWMTPVPSWCHHLQVNAPNSFVAQVAAKVMQCQRIHPTIESPQKESAAVEKPKKEAEKMINEERKQPSQPIQGISKRQTIITGGNFKGPTVFGGNVNIQYR